MTSAIPVQRSTLPIELSSHLGAAWSFSEFYIYTRLVDEMIVNIFLLQFKYMNFHIFTIITK